ncbi:MAG: glycosyltransferase [Bryobacterales bacterium]|nr:glycosyltransferase [Bryobacterales bacterium]MBV9399413.1 glycosyltransferase [Bryobacterales bacterium]
MLLSILIPVYNERTVVEQSLQLVLAAPLPENMDRELVIVDDRSTDGTWDILQRIAASEPRIRLFRHPVNQGKGAAVRTAIDKAEGDFCLVQDADMEYDPSEYPRLMRPLVDGHADAVFGSRYLAGEQSRVLPFWHSMINKGLTLFSNMFCNLNVTDMETCYKAFRTDLLKSIPIRSNRFGFEPEITMKVSKRKLRVYEVPISYHGRTYEEGKKIGWKDGAKAIGVILYFWLIDDLYVPTYGRGFLNSLTGTPKYLSWLTKTIRPHLRDTVLEIGAGMGNMTGRLMGKKLRYVAGENDPLYLHALRNRFLKTPSVTVCELDPEDPADFEPWQARFESVLCVNLLETVDNPKSVLACLASCLQPGGVMVVQVPQGTGLFGTLDQGMGTKRRFDAAELRGMLTEIGFTVKQEYQINKIGTLGWWFSSRILHRSRVSRPALKLWDKSVWLQKLIDGLLPWRGLSLVVVAERK